MRTLLLVLVVVILLGIFGPATLYTVDETQLAVVTRFGEIRGVNTTPGLKVKAPFIDTVNRFDKRLLRLDTPPSTLPDKEKEFLIIDAYARYRITDVEKFFKRLRTPQAAEDRLGRRIISALRNEIGNRTKDEIIGARVIQTVDEATGQDKRTVIPTTTRQEILTKVLDTANREVGPKRPYLRVQDARELDIEVREDLVIKIGEDQLIEISQELAAERAQGRVVEIGEDFGVELVDVRIKRADFPEAAQQNIFSRMRAERERISREFRAEGQEERDKIEANANRERTILLAEAERDAAQTRGDGEARAIEIFAQALEQNPEFFAFQRSLEAYKKFLSTNTTVILSSDTDLFQFLQDPVGFQPSSDGK